MPSPVDPTARRPRRERGAALLLALLLVALVTTLGAGMLWQQWRAVQVEGAGRARVQAAWILGGATDWSRLIMREDARTSSTDHAAEPWATPLAEARLSSFLAVDRERSSEVELEAFLSGSIVDAQARYNLRNLVDAATGQAAGAEVAALERLCAAVGLGAEVAPRIVQGLRAAWGPAARGAADESSRPLPPSRLDHLAWLGVDTPAIDALRPHVTLLPRATPLNLNTAGREALAAVLDIDAGSAERLVQRRQLRAFENLDQARAELPQGVDLSPARVAVASSHFIVTGRLRLDERVLEETAWLRREGSSVVVVERRQRQSALSATP